MLVELDFFLHSKYIADRLPRSLLRGVCQREAFQNSSMMPRSLLRGASLKGLRQVKDYQGASGKIDFSVNNWPENKDSILKQVTETGFEIINQY